MFPSCSVEEAKLEDQSKLKTGELLNQAANQLARFGSADQPPTLVNHSMQTDEVDGVREVPDDQVCIMMLCLCCAVCYMALRPVTLAHPHDTGDLYLVAVRLVTTL